MSNTSTSHSRCRRAGFTLSEILLAMLVFAIAITTILALLTRSVETAQEILTKDEAIGMSSAVESYMTSIPFYRNDGGLNAYNIVNGNIDLFAYKYRGDPDALRPVDNTPEPVADPLGGEVVSAVRYEGDPFLSEDLQAMNGRLFRVRLQVSEANPAGTSLVPNPNVGNPPAYNSAILVVTASFYPVPTVSFTPAEVVDPVYSFNFAVRR